MGYLVAHRRKAALGGTAIVLLIIYLCSIWINIREVWSMRMESRINKCAEFYVKPVYNSTETESTKKLSKVMNKRRDSIQEECTSLKTWSEKIPNLLVYDRVVYCGLPDTASELFYVKTSKIGNKQNKGPIPLMTDIETPAECMALNFTTVLIVQHPVERLVENFLDKAASLNHLKDENLVMEKPHNKEQQQLTFDEFLKHLMHHNDQKQLWTPYYDQCNPCKVRYDVIVEHSTVYKDVEYLHNLLGVTCDKRLKEAHHKRQKDLEAALNNLIDNLKSKHLLKKFEDVYELDYKLFNFKRYS